MTTTVIIFSVLFATLTYAVIVLGIQNRILRRRNKEVDDNWRRLGRKYEEQVERAKLLMNEKVALECEKAALEAKLAKYDHRNRRQNEKGWFVK